MVYLHLPMATVRERIRARGRTYEQRISEEYLGQLQERYLDHLRKLDAGRVLVVDLNGKDLLKDAVAYQRFMDLVTAVREPGHHVEHL
ncbi:MAG: deoxynucleoside kinase [Flavobacteriales bacterium]|nr:deoxynucleoside kinase [Flavobacteriales bacterium]